TPSLTSGAARRAIDFSSRNLAERPFIAAKRARSASRAASCAAGSAGAPAAAAAVAVDMSPGTGDADADVDVRAPSTRRALTTEDLEDIIGRLREHTTVGVDEHELAARPRRRAVMGEVADAVADDQAGREGGEPRAHSAAIAVAQGVGVAAAGVDEEEVTAGGAGGAPAQLHRAALEGLEAAGAEQRRPPELHVLVVVAVPDDPQRVH